MAIELDPAGSLPGAKGDCYCPAMNEQLPRVPDGLFSGLDSRLPSSIGLIVMIAARLERVVAVVAMSVENRDQNYYLAQDVSANLRVIRRRFKMFREPWQREAIERVLPYLERVYVALTERHGVVHRVWAITAGERWGGHKGERSGVDGENYQRLIDVGWNYTPERLQQVIDEYAALAKEGALLYPMVTAFPRLPGDGRDA